nr:reverse transcriptase domain-containing protein [Tanacetum cinerariifolium]
RPFPERPGKVKFLIVAIDYFTKWIEAKPVATITGNQIKKFMWDNIVCRFGLPGEIISDNGKQFRDNPFKDCTIAPISVDDYEAIGADYQAVANGDAASFPNVDDAELNIP